MWCFAAARAPPDASSRVRPFSGPLSESSLPGVLRFRKRLQQLLGQLRLLQVGLHPLQGLQPRGAQGRGGLRRLPPEDHGPLPALRGRQEVAHRLPPVLQVRQQPRRRGHLLLQRRQDLLQEGLLLVSITYYFFII